MSYQRDGFTLFPLFDDLGFKTFQQFGKEYFRSFLPAGCSDEKISEYHLWCDHYQVKHAEVLRAKNRHLCPPANIKDLLLGKKFQELLSSIGIHKYRLWDEGLGWLGFRLVRPESNDGYPFSCKAWGPAQEVLSIWIPVEGISRASMLHLLPGSHLKEYEKYLPKETHFTKDEYRLKKRPKPGSTVRPQLEEGEAILFHPKTLHEERVEKAPYTRLSYEFRIVPL